MDLPAHIRLVELVQTPEAAEAAEAVLTPDEAARRATFKSADRQQAFSLGRLAARTVLADVLDRDAQHVELEVLDDGSLAVPGTPWHLSISHSGAHAAAAIATTEIGLDLERVRPRPETLFRFMLHPDEMHLRDHILLPQDQQIVLFWALKEAVLKGKRTGLRRSPKSLRLEIDLNAGRAVVRGQRTWDARFDLRKDHVLAVAWPQ